MTDTLANPILNRPYDAPSRYFELGPHGPTGEIKHGRRQSESFIPISQAKKGQVVGDSIAIELDFDLTGERREKNTLINDLRREVEIWRNRQYPRVTPTTRKLLLHWADERRENRVLFCQREAAETAIYIAEVAGRDGKADSRQALDAYNSQHNAGLPRVALKMATGSGKTVVMAMIIAWHTLNKVVSPNDSRFVKQFLIVAPGITIRDRLRVLLPSEPSNYYDERDLIPSDLRGMLGQAQVIVNNYHAFLLRDSKEIKGVAANTRKLLLAGKSDPFKETPEAMASRVLRDFGLGSKKREILVLNDEAHHCYQDKPQSMDLSGLNAEEKKAVAAANEDARVWFKGLQAVHRRTGIKQVYDLSATPFFLGGSGYNEGYIFPWVVSDFSLMDAIESGIVKVPRTPVDDDAAGDLVTYLRLWDYVGDKLPKRKAHDTVGTEGWLPPKELEGALFSLYSSYEKSFAHWELELRPYGEPPPVMIIVCPNTLVSKLVHEWISGADQLQGETVSHRAGKLELFSNVVEGAWLNRPRTILVDSAQLESGQAMKDDFKVAAAAEIAAFKAQYRISNPGADTAKISDEDLLREVMNTVGKKGKLGEQVRCVVSVSMLTEGWDANTVTHVLGIRAFKSQLLCEQVVGRGLRRRSYALNENGMFEPEYANVYGIPFAFIPTDREVTEQLPRPPAIEVSSMPDREHLRITFPKLDGYRVEIPDEELHFDANDCPRFVIGTSSVPRWTVSAPLVGEPERTNADYAEVRAQAVAFKVAERLIDAHFSGDGSDRQPWRFPRLLQITKQWLAACVDVQDGYFLGHLLSNSEGRAEAAEAVYNSITRQLGNRRERLRPMLRRFDPVGSTGDVHFVTRKAVVETKKSEVSHVVLDGIKGNTWEQILSLECEVLEDVAAYVKNDHLGFVIPYVHQGRSHSYVPDFLLRLKRRNCDEFDRTLIVEVSGGQKSPGPTNAKALTARDSWCASVNNHGGFGRWGYIEVTSMIHVHEVLLAAIWSLYEDQAIIGDPNVLDDVLVGNEEVTRGS